MKVLDRLFVLSLLAGLTACGDVGEIDLGSYDFGCKTEADCPAGWSCSNNECVAPAAEGEGEGPAEGEGEGPAEGEGEGPAEGEGEGPAEGEGEGPAEGEGEGEPAPTIAFLSPVDGAGLAEADEVAFAEEDETHGCLLDGFHVRVELATTNLEEGRQVELYVDGEAKGQAPVVQGRVVFEAVELPERVEPAVVLRAERAGGVGAARGRRDPRHRGADGLRAHRRTPPTPCGLPPARRRTRRLGSTGGGGRRVPRAHELLARHGPGERDARRGLAGGARGPPHGPAAAGRRGVRGQRGSGDGGRRRRAAEHPRAVRLRRGHAGPGAHAGHAGRRRRVDVGGRPRRRHRGPAGAPGRRRLLRRAGLHRGGARRGRRRRGGGRADRDGGAGGPGPGRLLQVVSRARDHRSVRRALRHGRGRGRLRQPHRGAVPLHGRPGAAIADDPPARAGSILHPG